MTYPGSATPGHFNFSSITDTRTKAGASHTSVYTASTGETLTTSAEGATTLTTTDTYERPTAFKVGNDTAWSLTYDTNGRLSEVKQGTNQHRQTFAYNTNGYVSSVTNALNEQTSYTYDLSGRVTQITLPDTRVIGISYDANGNVTGITPPSRPQHGFVFNTMELLGTYQPPSIGVGITKDTTYTYNDDKQLTQISSPDGATVDFTYDSTSGNLTTITTPDGTYNLDYGPNNKLLNRRRAPSGIRNEFTYYGPLMESDSQVRASDSFLFGRVTFGFDSHHRVASRTIRGNAATPTSTINYTYNNDEKPTQVGDLALTYTYPSGRLSGTTLNNVADAYTYDSYGRLASYTATYTPTSTVLYTYTLTRDDVGRITQKVETIGGVTDTYEYAYDSAGRLSTVEKNNVVTDSFTYDSNSNRTSGTINGAAFTATYDDQDRILTFNSQTYTHNRNGDLTKIQWNLTDATDFVYDVMGNLKQATIPGGTVLDYTNDGMDRRIVKRSNSTFQWRYIYENQLRVAAVLNGSSAYGREFVYATKVNVPDYMIFSGNKFRIITDHLGSPRLAVRSDTGAISQRMDYTVLGHVTNDTNPGFQPFGFAGGIYDAQIGLVRFGARDYDPRIGRWTVKDPVPFAKGEMNMFGYVLGDPINFHDPTGKYWDEIFVQLVDDYAEIRAQEMDWIREEARRCEAKTIWLDDRGFTPSVPLLDPKIFPPPPGPRPPRSEFSIRDRY